ncbi:hypothetical protein TIFTF001_024001 [Ficus carica]|uniref:F-box domain-containing protein n=1 Tax=Ficus carica TaxID=3494 RepID=A0AA88AVC6_FICCA|nr:hypothetical protein TIFTF001_024001 [Ficus carica]
MVDTRRSKRINSTKASKRKRIRKKINNIEEAPPPETPPSRFMSDIVSDDLLIQILLRLPHARHAIRCTAVCKRWHSLINHQFIRSFMPHDSHKRSSDSSTSSSFISSSFGDLLLLVPPCNIHAYYICNPVTKQWLSLPAAPISSPYTTSVPGLRPGSGASQSCHSHGSLGVSIFVGPPSQLQAILSIYLFDKIGTSNTSTTKQICRFINLPDGFRQGCRASVKNLCLGVVKEQLRLSQLLREKKAGLVLRVWELKYSDNKNEETSEEDHGFWCMRVA